MRKSVARSELLGSLLAPLKDERALVWLLSTFLTMHRPAARRKLPLKRQKKLASLQKMMQKLRSSMSLVQSLTKKGDPFDPLVAPLGFALLAFAADVRGGVLSVSEVRRQTPVWVEAADAFGLWHLRYFIEDAVFERLYPREFQLMASILRRHSKASTELFEDVVKIIRHHARKAGIGVVTIVSRKKNMWGMYQKMKRKGKSINQVHDLFAARIITKTERDCYRMLRLLHRLWPHYPEHLADYIRSPKPNGYQSLHTIVRGLKKQDIEFQIRTAQMDYVAKYGPASHAYYKAEHRRYRPDVTDVSSTKVSS